MKWWWMLLSCIVGSAVLSINQLKVRISQALLLRFRQFCVKSISYSISTLYWHAILNHFSTTLNTPLWTYTNDVQHLAFLSFFIWWYTFLFSKTIAMHIHCVRTLKFWLSPVNLEWWRRNNSKCKGFFLDSLACNNSHQSHKDRFITAETGTSISTWDLATEMQPQLVGVVKQLSGAFCYLNNKCTVHHSIVLALLSLLLYQKTFYIVVMLPLISLKLNKAHPPSLKGCWK